MRQTALAIILVLSLFIMLPQAKAQEEQGLVNRVRNSKTTQFIQSITFCYKQNGVKYLPEYGFTTTDCRFNTKLVFFDLQGSTILPSSTATQDIQLPESVQSSTQANDAVNFYAMLVNSDQREIVTENEFTTSYVTLPDLLTKVFPDLNGKHDVSIKSWTELLPENTAQLKLTATVE